MREGLAVVPRETISDAYGPAREVPVLLRQLASANPIEGQMADIELVHQIAHQTDTSEAAVAAALSGAGPPSPRP